MLPQRLIELPFTGIAEFIMGNVYHIPLTCFSWRSPSFMLSCLTGMFAVLYTIYHHRLIRYKKVQGIRDRIAKDLHDEIGSTLSSISIYSTTAATMRPDQYPELIQTMMHIRYNVNAAMDNLSDIVWAINPAHESFSSLLVRLQIFACPLLQAQHIDFQTEIQDDMQLLNLPMHQRKNIYLILREALLNAAKYSGASHCSLSATCKNKKIMLSITDNGIGFDSIHPGLGGNGLANMQKRADELNASLTIQSALQQGTCVTLEVDYRTWRVSRKR